MRFNQPVCIVFNCCRHYYARLLSFILLLNLASPVFCHPSSDILFKRFTLRDGITQSTITCLLEDRNGFIWLGTWGGVCRWDGQHFTPVTHYDGEPALPMEMVRSLREDSLGNIWVGTKNGLIKVDGLTCKGRNYPIPGVPGTERFIYQCWTDSLLILVTYKGFGIYYPNSQTFRLLKGDVSSNFYPLKDITLSNDTILVLGSEKGAIFALFSKNQTVKKIILPNLANDIAPQSIIQLPGNKKIYLSNAKGIFEYRLKENECIPVYTPPGLLAIHKAYNYQYLYMACDSNYIWAVNYDGTIARYNHRLELMNYYPSTSYQYKNQNFEISPVQNILVSSTNMLWIATDGNGLCYHHPEWPKFQKVSLENISNLPRNIYVRNIAVSQSQLWVNCSNLGVLVFNDLYPNAQNNQYKLVLKNAGISSLKSLSDGNMLIGSTQNILLYSSQLQCLSTLQVKNLIDFTGIKYIDQINKNLFVGQTSSEIFAFNFNGFQLRKWINDGIFCSMVVDENKLLISTYQSGIKLYQVDTLGFNLIDSLKFSTGFNPFSIAARSMTKDLHGGYWFGSGNQLIHANQKLEIIELLTPADGLKQGIIFMVQADSSGHIWIGSSQGLACYWPNNRQFVHYSQDDGLQSEEFNSGASLMVNKNLLYAGGINGFNYFDPDEVNQNSHLANPKLMRLLAGNSNISMAQLNPKHPVELSYLQNSIEFDVIAADLSNPERNLISVKLEGADNDWTQPANTNPIRYAGLKPGKYTLFAKGANCDGYWSKPKLMASFIIKPPFYQTAWFISLMVFTLIGILVFAAVSIVKRKAKKRIMALEIEKQMLEIRYQISSDIHDDIGAGLTRISLLSQLVHKESAKVLKDESLQRIDKLGQTSRQLISSLNELIWVVNPENDTLANLLARIRSYAFEFLEDSDIGLELYFPEEVPYIQVRSDFRRHFLLIVKEALNNSVKYSCASKVEIKFTIDHGDFSLSISDNGIGFDTDKTTAGNGQRTMLKNALAIGARLELKSTRGEGTFIEVQGILK